MNFKIYLPKEVNSTKCAIVYDKDTIRVYDSQPEINSSTSYSDFFINSHYIEKVGSESFSEVIPVCLDSSNFTTDVYYRNDFDSILVIFLIFLLILFYFPYIIISRLFGRWFKW